MNNSPGGRSKIADALVSKAHADGGAVVEQGEMGNTFFFCGRRRGNGDQDSAGRWCRDSGGATQAKELLWRYVAPPGIKPDRQLTPLIELSLLHLAMSARRVRVLQN